MNASDDELTAYFDNVFSKGRELDQLEADKYNSNPNKYGSANNARVIDEYNLMENNCVKKTIEGAKASNSQLDFEIEYHTMTFIPSRYSVVRFAPSTPSELIFYLQTQSLNRYNSMIKDVTDSVLKEYH